MPYAQEHALLTWGGKIGTQEIWQCGTHWIPSSVSAQTWEAWRDQVGLVDIFTAIATWMSVTGTGGFAGAWTLSWVKLAVLKTDGEYLTEARMHSVASGIGSGHSLSGTPYSNTCAITLHSGRTLGKGNSNRFFAPPINAGVEAGTGTWSTSETTALLTRTKTMLKAVEGELGTVGRGMKLQILGQTGTGTERDVAQLRVGRVPDTQRRRRNALAEGYQIVSW